jgi:hypothetical protein
LKVSNHPDYLPGLLAYFKAQPPGRREREKPVPVKYHSEHQEKNIPDEDIAGSLLRISNRINLITGVHDTDLHISNSLKILLRI